MFSAFKWTSPAIRVIVRSTTSVHGAVPRPIVFNSVAKPFLSSRNFQQYAILHSESAAAFAPAPEFTEEKSTVTITRFQELADNGCVHPNLIDAITNGMKYEEMTEVQSATINQTLKGTDMYVTISRVLVSLLTYSKGRSSKDWNGKNPWIPPPYP